MSTTHTPPYLGAGPGTENVGSSLIGLGMGLQRPLDGLIEGFPLADAAELREHRPPRSSLVGQPSQVRPSGQRRDQVLLLQQPQPLNGPKGAHPAPRAALLWLVGHDGLGHDARNPPHGVLASLLRPGPGGTVVPELGSHAYHPLLVRPAAVRKRGSGLFAPPVGPSLGIVVGERGAVLASGGVRAGGRDPGTEGGWHFNLTRPARLYGQPILCDLHDRLDRHQERLLAHPEEASGVHLQEAHLALLVVYVEILHGAYALPFRVVDVLAAEVVFGILGHEVRVA